MSLKKTLDVAGISMAEFGVMCGVSRTAVSKWCGGLPQHVLRRNEVAELVSAIQSAIVNGDLPIDRKRVTVAERRYATKIAIESHGRLR